MFSFKSKLAIVRKIMLVGLAMTALACNKGGGSFSVLTDQEQFTAPSGTFEPRKMDILFVIDNSGSMQSSQNNLATNFKSFIQKFITKGYNFKIGVTTTDAFYGEQFLTNGCSLCRVEQARFRSGTSPKIYVLESANYNLALTTEQTRLANDFSLNAKVGTNGSGDERAFSSFQAALNSSYNAGFHRPEAYLAVVIVSDEEDFSQSAYSMNENYSNANLYSVTKYRDYLATFTGGIVGEDFSVATVSILDDACRDQLANSNTGGVQKVAQRYIQIADLTGGAKVSLCSAFDTTLDNITTQIIGIAKPIYTLSKKPIVASIKVIVDGVVVPQSAVDGWSYDSAANTITINGSTYKPNAGSSVTIDYDPDLS